MQRTRVATTFLTVLLAATTLATGCSGDDGCEGMAYHADLGEDGAETPIGALEAWLGGHEGLPQPPDEGWVVVDSGDGAAEVVLTNEDGDGWWVSAARTASGGWVVNEATADAVACADELSSLS